MIHLSSSPCPPPKCYTLLRKSPRAASASPLGVPVWAAAASASAFSSSSSSLLFANPPIVGGNTPTPFSVTTGFGFLIPVVHVHVRTQRISTAHTKRHKRAHVSFPRAHAQSPASFLPPLLKSRHESIRSRRSLSQSCHATCKRDKQVTLIILIQAET